MDRRCDRPWREGIRPRTAPCPRTPCTHREAIPRRACDREGARESETSRSRGRPRVVVSDRQRAQWTARHLREWPNERRPVARQWMEAVSYTHLRAHETDSYLVCRLL